MIASASSRSILFAVAAFAPVAAMAQASPPIRLITAEEARLPTITGVQAPVRNMTRGPGIDRVAPAPVGLDGPFRFAVKFKPRNGVPIDPASVRVIYQRQPAVDLTARVKAFITADGIDAPAVLVPPGKHLVEVEATDKEGRTGRGQVTLTVDGAN